MSILFVLPVEPVSCPCQFCCSSLGSSSFPEIWHPKHTLAKHLHQQGPGRGPLSFLRQFAHFLKEPKKPFVLKDKTNCHPEQNLPQLDEHFFFKISFSPSFSIPTPLHTYTHRPQCRCLNQTEKALIPALPLTTRWAKQSYLIFLYLSFFL